MAEWEAPKLTSSVQPADSPVWAQTLTVVAWGGRRRGIRLVTV